MTFTVTNNLLDPTVNTTNTMQHLVFNLIMLTHLLPMSHTFSMWSNTSWSCCTNMGILDAKYPHNNNCMDYCTGTDKYSVTTPPYVMLQLRTLLTDVLMHLQWNDNIMVIYDSKHGMLYFSLLNWE